MQGRYAHARQLKRAKQQTRKLRIFLGRVIRDIRRKCQAPDESLSRLLTTQSGSSARPGMTQQSVQRSRAGS